MSMTPWLGGADEAPALRLSAARASDSALSYGELRERVASCEISESGIVHARSRDQVELLVCVLAALHNERPVLVSDPADAAPIVRAAPPSAGLIVMTSGSSGRSRAVARTASSWSDSFSPFAEATGLSSGDSVALSGPLHVSMHLFAALHTLWLGAVLSDDATTASAVHCTPTVLGRLLSSATLPGRLIVAGASLPAAARDAARARGSLVTEYYGAAELSFVAISDDAGSLRAFPGVEIELRDNDRERHGQSATVWVRSPYVSLGYAQSPTEPSRPGAFQLARDGFASVGDLAEWGNAGELRVRGRADSAVTTAGTTVLSEDIERALEALPTVRAAAVIADAHPVLGEIVVAVVEIDTGEELPDAGLGASATTAEPTPRAGEQLRIAANAVLSPVERPRRWLLVDTLPRTASGKLAKGVLRTGLESGAIPYRELGASADV